MADTAGFFLDDNDNVVYVDAQGFDYYPNPQLDPAYADAYGIKYVRCDEGKYYFQSAATEAVMRSSQGQGYEVQYQAPRNSGSGGALNHGRDSYAYPQQDPAATDYYNGENYGDPQEDPSALNVNQQTENYGTNYYQSENHGYQQEDPSALNQQTENYAYSQEDPSALNCKEENYGYAQEDPTARMSSSDEEETRRAIPSHAVASDPMPRVSSSAGMQSHGSSNALNDSSRSDESQGHRKRESKSTKGKSPSKPSAIRRTKSNSSARPGSLGLPRASSPSSKSGQPSRSKSGGLLHLVEAAMNANANVAHTPQELDEKDFEKALKRESNRRKKGNNRSKKSRSVSPTRRKKSDGYKKTEGDHDAKPGRKASQGEASKKGKKGPELSRSRSTGESKKEKSKRGPRALSAPRSGSRRNLMADQGHHPEPEKSRRGPRTLSGSPARSSSRRNLMIGPRSASRRNLMIEPKSSEEDGQALLRGWDSNSGSDATLLRGWASNAGASNTGSTSTLLRGWDSGPDAVRNSSQRNLMVEPREDKEDTQQFMGRAGAPRRGLSCDETSSPHASASTKRGGRPALGRPDNCRRAGMLSGTRAARNSQRNLFRKHYNAAVNHYEHAKEEEEEQIKEQAAMERIRELEAQLAQAQQHQLQPGELVHSTHMPGNETPPSRHVSPSNSAKDGLMGLKNAAMLVGMTAVNTTMGAGKLVANVGSATTHLAADATMLVGKTAVNTTVGAAKMTANVGLATTHLAADATMLVGKTAVNTTVGAAKMTANVGLATTHLAADATMLVGKTAVNTTVGAAKMTANVGLATTHLAADATMLVGKTAVNTTVGAAKLTANVGMATAGAVNNTVGVVAGATHHGIGNSVTNSPERPRKITSMGRSISNSERASNKKPMAAFGNLVSDIMSGSPERPKKITSLGRSISNSERTSNKKLPMATYGGLYDDWVSSSIELDGSGQSGTRVL